MLVFLHFCMQIEELNGVSSPCNHGTFLRFLEITGILRRGEACKHTIQRITIFGACMYIIGNASAHDFILLFGPSFVYFLLVQMGTRALLRLVFLKFSQIKSGSGISNGTKLRSSCFGFYFCAEEFPAVVHNFVLIFEAPQMQRHSFFASKLCSQHLQRC